MNGLSFKMITSSVFQTACAATRCRRIEVHLNLIGRCDFEVAVRGKAATEGHVEDCGGGQALSYTHIHPTC